MGSPPPPESPTRPSAPRDNPTSPPTPADRDPYVYPGTEVLRNHAHTVDEKKLYELEGRFLAKSLLALRDNPVSGRFDIQHAAAIHARIAGDVYPFAGEFRKSEVGKVDPNTGRLVPFPLHEDVIPLLSHSLQRDIAEKNYLQGLSKKEISAALSEVAVHMHSVHPWRDFNSRTTREFTRTLALSVGYDLDWRRTEHGQVLSAIFARTFDENHAALPKMLERAIVNARPDPALKRLYEEATFPELPWRGTVGEAVARSARGTRTHGAFVDASWEDAAHVRLWSAPEVMAILDKTRAAMPQKQGDGAEYGVRRIGGAVYHVPSNKDLFIRLDKGREDYPERLQHAVDRHFGRSPEPPKGGRVREPDLDGP